MGDVNSQQYLSLLLQLKNKVLDEDAVYQEVKKSKPSKIAPLKIVQALNDVTNFVAYDMLSATMQYMADSISDRQSFEKTFSHAETYLSQGSYGEVIRTHFLKGIPVVVKRYFHNVTSLDPLEGKVLDNNKFMKAVPEYKEGLFEYVIGKVALNQLRAFTPNFMYVYAHFSCPQKKGLKICDKAQVPLVTHVVFEYVQGIPLVKITDPAIVRVCLLQVIGALNIAQQVCGYTHNDLHPGNVLIRTLDKPIDLYYPFYTPTGMKTIKITTKYLAVIVDYGMSYALLKDGMITSFKNVDPKFFSPYSIRPGNDMFRIVMNMTHFSSFWGYPDIKLQAGDEWLPYHIIKKAIPAEYTDPSELLDYAVNFKIADLKEVQVLNNMEMRNITYIEPSVYAKEFLYIDSFLSGSKLYQKREYLNTLFGLFYYCRFFAIVHKDTDLIELVNSHYYNNIDIIGYAPGLYDVIDKQAWIAEVKKFSAFMCSKKAYDTATRRVAYKRFIDFQRSIAIVPPKNINNAPANYLPIG